MTFVRGGRSTVLAYCRARQRSAAIPIPKKEKEISETVHAAYAAFADHYRSAYATIYDRPRYAYAIEQIKALGQTTAPRSPI